MTKNYILPTISLLNNEKKEADDKHYKLLKLLKNSNLWDKLVIPIGITESDESYYVDLNKASGIFVCGETGSGKSVFLDSVIVTLLLKNTVDDLNFLFIDPNMVELNEYDGISSLLKNTISNPINSFNELENIVGIMDDRRKLFEKARITDIEYYNNNYSEKLPHIMVVIDESCDVLRIESSINLLEKILRDGKDFGVHLILATSSYLKKSFSKEFLSMFTYLVSFDLASDEQAQFINIKNSNWLSVGGEAYVKDFSSITKIQTPYISDKEIKDVVEFIVNNN